MRVLLFIAIYLSTISLLSQEKVSQIEGLRTVDNYIYRDFLSFDNNQYLIERGSSNTKISLIDGANLIEKHILSYRPINQNMVYSRDVTDVKSRAILVNGMLYELFSKSIYVIDFSTGELVQIVDIKHTDLIILGEFQIVNDLFVFQAIDIEGEEAFYTYDHINGNLTRIDISIENNNYIIGNQLYSLNEDRNILSSYDLMLQEEKVVLKAESFFNNPFEFQVQYKDEMVISEWNGVSYHISNENKVDTIFCIEEPVLGIKNMHLEDNILIYNVNENLEKKIIVKNLSNCEEVFSYVFSEQEYVHDLNFVNFNVLEEGYFFFSEEPSSSLFPKHFLLNLNENQIFALDISTREFLAENSFTLNDKLYFHSYDRAFPYWLFNSAYPANLLEWDFNSLSVEKLISSAWHSQETIWMIPDLEKSSVGLFSNTADSKSFVSFDLNLKTYENGPSLLGDKDFGIQSLSNTTEYYNAMYFFSNGSFYKTKGASTSLLSNSGEVSSYIRLENIVYALVQEEESASIFSANLEDESFSFSEIDEFEFVNPSIANTYNSFVNNTGDENHGYYNLEESKYYIFAYEGMPLTARSVYVSANSILIHSREDDIYYLINTSSNETIRIGDINSIPGFILPDLSGGFYLLPDSKFNQNHWLEKLSSTGVLSPFLIHFPQSNNQFLIETKGLLGKIKTFALNGIEAVEFFSEKAGVFKKHIIPYTAISTNQNVFWAEVQEHVIVESKTDDRYHTYYFSFDSEPIDLTPEGKEDRLVEVIIENDLIVLFYFDEEGFIKINHYSISINSLEARRKYNGYARSNASYTGLYTKISDSEYLMSYDDGLLGKELWRYNLNDSNLELVKDIQEGVYSSKPNDFISLNGYKYFTAIGTDGTKQWYRMLDERTTSVVEEFVETEKVLAFPNPSKNRIFINANLKELKVYNFLGIENMFFQNYRSGNEIDISQLKSGIYFFQGKSVLDENRLYGQFLKL